MLLTQRQIGPIITAMTKKAEIYMKLSLVVPCYNEEENVAAFQKAVMHAFQGCGYAYEIIYVDDGSSDQTLPELEKLYAAQDCPVSVISFSRNFGKEAGLYAGLSRAKGDYISLIDADLQQRPELVREMVEILDAKPEFDIVAAYQDKRGDGKVLTFFKENFYRLINQLSTVKLRPDASDFRTFRRKVAESIPVCRSITGFPRESSRGWDTTLVLSPTPPVSGRPVPPNGPLRSCSAMPSTASSVFPLLHSGRHLSGPDRRLRIPDLSIYCGAAKADLGHCRAGIRLSHCSHPVAGRIAIVLSGADWRICWENF